MFADNEFKEEQLQQKNYVPGIVRIMLLLQESYYYELKKLDKILEKKIITEQQFNNMKVDIKQAYKIFLKEVKTVFENFKSNLSIEQEQKLAENAISKFNIIYPWSNTILCDFSEKNKQILLQQRKIQIGTSGKYIPLSLNCCDDIYKDMSFGMSYNKYEIMTNANEKLYKHQNKCYYELHYSETSYFE